MREVLTTVANVKSGKPLAMTMHRAKGLECTHVLLFGVYEGAVPRILRDYEVSGQDKADALLRERSLVYVAATRARDVLAVTWSGARSPFLAESVASARRGGAVSRGGKLCPC